MARKSDGFSLIELLIAMVVTLLVSGAVFGLLTAGQSAFKREPQLTERQQSLRQAMSIIQEDILRAGTGLPAFVQVFTPGLNATGALQGPLGPAPTDALELLAGDPSCPAAPTCNTVQAGLPNNISVLAQPATCAQNSVPGFFAFFDGVGANFAIQPVAAVIPVAGCGNNQLAVGARAPGTPVGGGFIPSGYSPVQVIRYEIAACLAPDAAVPCLYRSTTGRADAAGVPVGAAPGPPGNATWQVVARGIEDLQVQYRTNVNPGGVPAGVWLWADTPGAVVGCVVGAVGTPCANAGSYNSLVTEVQVTLVARTVAGGLQGETNTAGGVGPARVRGQLTGIFTPRTALATLSQEPTPRWR